MPEAKETFKAKGARFVRFYPSDWRSGCIGLSVEQEGLYWRICAHYYETGRRLPLDDKEAAHRLMMNPKNYRRVRDELIALEKIRRHDDGYGNDRAERELEKAVGEPAQKADAVFAADLDAARGSSDCERQDGRDQGEGRQGSEPIPEVDRETIGDQSPINPESIVDQSTILVEKDEQNQHPSLEPVASSQEPKKDPHTPKGALDGMPSHVKPVLSWNNHFAHADESSAHAGVIRNEAGAIVLVNGTYQFWLERFGNDPARLELALIEVDGEINATSRKPLAADVGSRLARKAGDKLDRDKRYASAAASKPQQQTFSRSISDALREMELSDANHVAS